MRPDYIIEMCKYSIEKANDELDTSELLLKNKKFSKSLNSSYYAIFHATRGLLEAQLKNARDFVAEITKYLEKELGIAFNSPS